MSVTIKRTVAGSLRAGDKITVNNKFMIVKSVSFRQARTDKRAISMMTRGRDLAPVVQVDFINAQGRLVSRDFYDTEVVDVCRELLAPSNI